ncbi:MAG TPA: sulfotransferase [Jatrophihabitantaceae bacterium]|jgi:hypothetical protein
MVKPASLTEPPVRGHGGKRPILVTGAPRSGTTFLGTVLSLNRGVSFIYEPMSRVYGLRDVPDPLLYVRAGSSYEPTAERMTRDLLAGRGQFRKPPPDAAAASRPRAIARRMLGSEVSLRYRRDALNPLRRRWLVKDPWAAMSSEWLHRQLGMQTVVLVRHPVPVVRSWQRFGWDMRIQELMAIDELMADHLGPLVEGVDVDALDPVENAALVWRAYYFVLNRYLDRNPEMIAVRHEDLSARPAEVLQALYRDLDLDFDHRVQARVASYTGAGNQVTTSGETLHELRRDSAAVATQWRRDVDPAERDKIRRWVEPEASRWYSDDEW